MLHCLAVNHLDRDDQERDFARRIGLGRESPPICVKVIFFARQVRIAAVPLRQIGGRSWDRPECCASGRRETPAERPRLRRVGCCAYGPGSVAAVANKASDARLFSFGEPLKHYRMDHPSSKEPYQVICKRRIQSSHLGSSRTASKCRSICFKRLVLARKELSGVKQR